MPMDRYARCTPSRRSASAAGAVLMLASCVLGAGCVETPCGPRLRCDPPAEDESPPIPIPICPAEPAEGLVPEDACGVFASSSLGDDANPGTRDAPVKTMAKAIELAAQRIVPRVHACFETFPEAVRVGGSLEIWGGFDCTNGWIHSSEKEDTLLEPRAGEVPLTFEARSTSTLFDVAAHAASASTPGGSSIAAVVLEGADVRIHRGELIGGNGARDGDGAPGHPMSQPAKAGSHGVFGQDACTGDFVTGAEAVRTVCEEQGSMSGRGGEGTSDHGLSGGDGELMPIPNPSGFGLGGQGATSADNCINGTTGADGFDGAHGLGARGLGTFDANGVYLGVNGEDGGQGLPGQGGGGGGGTRAGAMFCGMFRKAGGASGGSGGSGGCGGRGGQGGDSGGASIGLVILNASVEINGAEITGALGGDGGDGGVFQIGGAPGAGALGGQGVGGSPFGCSGGDGGKGGNGGHGGGGHGGPSLGIAYVGTPPLLVMCEPHAGTGGKGGLGASPSVVGSAGDDGLAAGIVTFPQ
jgi:hypothetical protein